MLERKMAELICNYSLGLKEGGDVFLVRAETVSEPLVKEFVKQALELGAHPILRMMISEQQSIFL